MRGKKATAEPGNAGSARREAEAAHESAADEREQVADERQRQAEERERAADQRERTADQREALDDERERRADERERRADEREAAAAERQREIDERERELVERTRRAGVAIETLEQRTLEAIARSRALLELSGEHLNRQEAAVRRGQASRGRHQAEADRASAESERAVTGWLPDPAKLIEHGVALHQQARTVIEALAATEDEIARLHEALAARHPERREEYLGTAEQARASARRAREILRRLTG